MDLESLATGERGFYTDGDEQGALLFGFTYLATGALSDWKHYRRDPDDKYVVVIDRYDAEGRVVSHSEFERAGGPELWKGPASLLQNTTEEARIPAIFLAKEAKEQSYLRLLPS